MYDKPKASKLQYVNRYYHCLFIFAPSSQSCTRTQGHHMRPYVLTYSDWIYLHLDKSKRQIFLNHGTNMSLAQ